MVKSHVKSQAARDSWESKKAFPFIVNENGRRESANPDDVPCIRRSWWRQAGKRVKESTVMPGRRCRKNEGRRTAEDEREGEGAHYVSVISRIRRVFSICSKAPLVRRRPGFRCVGASAVKKTPGGRENREKRARRRKGEEKREGRNEKEHDSRERRKTGRERACNLRAHHIVNRVGCEREKERESCTCFLR